MTGDGDVSSAVEAVKSGAYDYLVKPLDARSIVSRVRGAVATFARHDGGTGGKIALSMDVPGQRLLTPREREALTQIAEGASNKEVGRRLSISPVRWKYAEPVSWRRLVRETRPILSALC